MSITDRLKQKALEKQEREKKVQKSSRDTVSLVEKEEFPVAFKINEIKLVEDKEVNRFLNEKSREVAKVQAKASLTLGRIFDEVNKKLSGSNHHDGFYGKWLEINGYNKKTALRHRKRYELWLESKSEPSRAIIAILSIRLLEKLYSSNKKEEIINKLNTGEIESKDELLRIVEEKIEEVEVIEEAPKKKYEIPFYETVFGYEKKIGKLKPEARGEVYKELEELEEEIRRLKRMINLK